MESQFYVANSASECLIYGNQLENGMRVLIEDTHLRGPDQSNNNPYDKARQEECNQLPDPLLV